MDALYVFLRLVISNFICIIAKPLPSVKNKLRLM